MSGGTGVDTLLYIDSIISICYGMICLILFVYTVFIKETELKYRYDDSYISKSTKSTNTSDISLNRKNHSRISSQSGNNISQSTDITINNSKISSKNQSTQELSSRRRYETAKKKKKSIYYYLRRAIIVPAVALICESAIIFNQSSFIQLFTHSCGYLSSLSLFMMFAMYVHRLFLAMARSLIFKIPASYGYFLMLLGINLVASCIVAIFLCGYYDKNWPDAIYFCGASSSCFCFLIMIHIMMHHVKKTTNISVNKIKNVNNTRADRSISRIVVVLKYTTLLLILAIPAMILRAYISFSDFDERFFEHGELKGSLLSIAFTNSILLAVLCVYALSNTMY